MEEHENTTKRRVQRKTFRDLLPLIVIVFILLFTSIYFLFPKNNQEVGPNPPADSNYTSQEQAQSGEISLDNTNDNSPSGSLQTNIAQKDTSVVPSNSAATKADPAAPLQSSSQNSLSEDHTVSSYSQCDVLSDSVTQFFNTLDQRTYIRNFQIDEKSSVYFPKLIQKLSDNPPIVTGETDDLFTILQNTAHFFRIIGKKNILVLKGILDREKETFEQTLADFYLLTNDPACLKNKYNLSIDDETLYLYSGFFLNTMGGRLYLFRRDSMSRMVVNFYAVMIMEKANREGRNRYGIEIKTPIDTLIEDIESSKLELKLRDFYLDSLYDMKERYN